MKHEVKCLIPYFEHINVGIKTFEVRKNDRDYGVGDTLVLREFGTNGRYSGRVMEADVVFIMTAYDLPSLGMPEDLVVMGIKPGMRWSERPADNESAGGS